MPSMQSAQGNRTITAPAMMRLPNISCAQAGAKGLLRPLNLRLTTPCPLTKLRVNGPTIAAQNHGIYARRG